MSTVRIALFFVGIILMIVAVIGFIDAQAVEAGRATFTYKAVSSTSGPILTTTPILVEELTATATPVVASGEEEGPEAPTEEAPAEEAPAEEAPAEEAPSVPSFATLPSVGMIGTHVVQPGETLYCIGRAYAVQPQVIAQTNGLALNGILANRQTLLIPAVPWDQVLPGQICAPQFRSPYVATPTVTSTPVPQSMPGATPMDQLGAPTLAPSPTATPVTETRRIVAYVPTGMALGQSLEVILTFNPEAPAGAEGAVPVATVTTITPDLDRLVALQPLRDVHYFDEHRLIATARLDAAGFMVSPPTEIRYPVRQGEALVWRWSIKPLEAEPQTVIISLWLTYEPKRPNVEPVADGLYWSAPFLVNARRTFFGIILNLQTFMTLAGTLVGLLISVTQATQLFVRREPHDA